jgi:hypothetical protein
MDLALVETTLLESVSSTADNLVLGKLHESTALERSDPYDTSIRISIVTLHSHKELVRTGHNIFHQPHDAVIHIGSP